LDDRKAESCSLATAKMSQATLPQTPNSNLPVSAAPITSPPPRMSGMASACIGVGSIQPMASTARISSGCTIGCVSYSNFDQCSSCLKHTPADQAPHMHSYNRAGHHTTPAFYLTWQRFRRAAAAASGSAQEKRRKSEHLHFMPPKFEGLRCLNFWFGKTPFYCSPVSTSCAHATLLRSNNN
jgi:hypothetical protein